MILFIHGPETYQVRQKVNQAVEKAVSQGVPETNVKRLDAAETDLPELMAPFQNQGLFAERQIVVIRDGLTALSAEEAETLVETAEKTGAQTVVILAEYGKPDRRRGAFKHAVKSAQKSWEFPELDSAGAQRFAREYAAARSYQIQPAAISALVEAAGHDGWRLVTELDKLSLAAGDGQITPALVSEQVASEESGDIFALVDAAGRRQTGTALEAFRALVGSGEPPLRIMAMLMRQYRLLLVIHDLVGRKLPDAQIQSELARSVGPVPPFVMRKLKIQAGMFTDREVVENFDQLAEIDYRIKTGKIDAEPALELFIVEASQA
jgi:DNA polymerase-3 subunit delta